MLKQESLTKRKNTIADRLDGLIAVFSPGWAAKRQSTRLAMDVKARWYHKSADYSRSRKNWVVGLVTPDTANLNELETIRARSDDLMRNNSIATGVIDTFQYNVVGSGIRPQSRVDFETIGITKDAARALQTLIERKWKTYAKKITNDERSSFWELQGMTSYLKYTQGEAFLVRRFRKRQGTPYSGCWQIVQPDRVRNPYGQANSAKMRDGIELGEHGEVVKYHVANASPHDLYADWSKAYQTVAIDAYDKNGRPNVLHYYTKKAPDQTHGLPLLSPVMDVFDHLNGYMESEWVRNRVAACFAAFIKRAGDAGDMAATGSSYTSAGERHEVLKPGTIQYLNEGEEITFANANIPGSQFEPFVIKTLQFIGAALGIPIELLLKDFSNVNYSSARAALLEAWRMFDCEQGHLVEMVCEPIWQNFVDELYLRGELGVRNYDRYRAEYTNARWITPARKWVDPMKEAQAKVLLKDNNLATLAGICAEQGEDWEELLHQRATEHTMEDELGLLPAVPTARAPFDNSGEQTASNEDTSNGDGKKQSKTATD